MTRYIWLVAMELGGCVIAPHATSAQQPEEVDIVLLAPDTASTTPKSVVRIPATDARWAEVMSWIDNEAARFARRLVAQAWRVAGREGPLPPLPILLDRGGNTAAFGYRERRPNGTVVAVDSLYIVLDPQRDRFRGTLLHEAGHVAHAIVIGGSLPRAAWASHPHSTFAVTDPVTALGEGFAISLETLWGHYANDAEHRAFIDRSAADFRPGGTRGAYYFPANDLLNFSQTWSRYSAIRDGLAAFEGFAADGDIMRAQYDPARDRARLKRGNAMISSEGVVASTMFWIAVRQSGDALAFKGLLQPQILAAEVELLRGLNASSTVVARARPDIIDVVSVIGPPDSELRRIAGEVFLGVTRGVTVNTSVRDRWLEFYRAALHIDLDATLAALKYFEPFRNHVLNRFAGGADVFRDGIGAPLIVTMPTAMMKLVGLETAFPLTFDINGISDAELAFVAGTNHVVRDRINAELVKGPFQTIRDFEERVGLSLATLGLREANH